MLVPRPPLPGSFDCPSHVGGIPPAAVAMYSYEPCGVIRSASRSFLLRHQKRYMRFLVTVVYVIGTDTNSTFIFVDNFKIQAQATSEMYRVCVGVFVLQTQITDGTLHERTLSSRHGINCPVDLVCLELLLCISRLSHAFMLGRISASIKRHLTIVHLLPSTWMVRKCLSSFEEAANLS